MADFLKQNLSSMGINLTEDALLILTAIMMFALGVMITRVFAQRAQRRITADLQAQHEAGQSALDDQLDQLSHAFSALSQEALRLNNESFLTLAQQSFSQLQANASNELKMREQGFSNLLLPIKQSLAQTDEQLKQLNQDRKISETRLSEQIKNLLGSQGELHTETRNLVNALRRPEVRGQWGELTLKRLVELAGLSEYCDFDEQITVATEHGLLRPDMIVNLPSERQLVVDVKTPLDAYINATETSDADAQERYLVQHTQNVKARIKELAKKQYWQQFARSPDFVILFIPGDQFLSAALDHDKNLLEFALQKRILLATPVSLVGLLRAVAYGWNQDSLSKNSDEIRQLGETLYHRLQVLTEHLNKLGNHLDQSVNQFNNVIGSYASNTVPAVRKLSQLGIKGDAPKELDGSLSSVSRKINSKTDPKA